MTACAPVVEVVKYAFIPGAGVAFVYLCVCTKPASLVASSTPRLAFFIIRIYLLFKGLF